MTQPYRDETIEAKVERLEASVEELRLLYQRSQKQVYENALGELRARQRMAAKPARRSGTMRRAGGILLALGGPLASVLWTGARWEAMSEPLRHASIIANFIWFVGSVSLGLALALNEKRAS